MSSTPSEKPGLQAERTQLSWERSAFGFLIGGALALLGHGTYTVGKAVLPIVGAMLAILVVWLGRRRARRIMETPKAEVLLLGWATAGFAALILVVNSL
jgi:uncharacterized membrane protein YidH (DUF202 family)